MIARQTSGGAEAAPTVVQLPTSAPRKVRQTMGLRELREAVKQLPQFPKARSLWPEQRKALESAKIIDSMTRSPELLMITAIFRALGELDRAKVQAFCAMTGLKDDHLAATQASEWLKVISGNDATTINYALTRFRAGEWE